MGGCKYLFNDKNSHLFNSSTCSYYAYQVILEPVIGQFREFDFPRVHTRIGCGDCFLCTD